MTEEEKKNVKTSAHEEGFDYCFDGYSNFREIKDEKFHELRKAYLNAKKNLENYFK